MRCFSSSNRSVVQRLSLMSPFPQASVPTITSGGPKQTPRLEFAKRHTAAGVGRMTDLAMTAGKGAFVLTDNNEGLE